jgi:hypothetical protein
MIYTHVLASSAAGTLSPLESLPDYADLLRGVKEAAVPYEANRFGGVAARGGDSAVGSQIYC